MKRSLHTIAIDAHYQPNTLLQVARVLGDERCPAHEVQMAVTRDGASARITLRFRADAFTLDAVSRKLRVLIDVRSAVITPYEDNAPEAVTQ